MALPLRHELKFLVTRDGWVPSYGRLDDTHLYLRDHLWNDPDTGERVDDESLPHVDTPDEKFVIAEQGNYKIELNIEKLTITITKTNTPHFESTECGPAYYHTIEGVSTTNHKIESVTINDTEVNHDGTKEHIRILFKSGD